MVPLCSLEPRSGPLYIVCGRLIGTGSRIVESLEVGENVIIKAALLGIRILPNNNAIVVGVPAKVINIEDYKIKFGAWLVI